MQGKGQIRLLARPLLYWHVSHRVTQVPPWQCSLQPDMHTTLRDSPIGLLVLVSRDDGIGNVS